MRRLPALLLGLAFLGATAARAEDPADVTVRLAPDPVSLGEAATLEIQVTSSGFGGPEVVPRFELDNLDRLSGPFQAQSHKWVNGKTSSSVQLIWRMRPKALGRARVFAVRVDVDGRAYSLPDQEIAVVDSPPPTATPQPLPSSPFPKDPFEGLFGPPPSTRRRLQQEPKVDVRVEVDPPSPYVGQQVRYRLVLYTQTDISAFNPLGLPDFRGFWAREVELPQRSRPDWVDVGGERFGKVVMLQRALYPLQSGQIKIEPIDVELVLRVADAGFFGPFGRDVPKTIRTRETVVDVRPLPPAPPGFAGVVGDLSATAALDRERVEVGQAATYQLTVESRANLQGLAAPELDLPAGLVAYPPRPESSERLTGGSLLARRTWSYVLVPSQVGDFEIPPVRLTRFDPAAREYRTEEASGVRLEVVAGVDSTSAPAPTPTVEAPTVPSPSDTPHLLLGLAIGLGALALLAGGFLLGRRSGVPRLDARPRVDLEKALRSAAESAPREAAEAFYSAWRAFLAARFGAPPSGTRERLRQSLTESPLDPGRVERIEAVLEEIEYLRHAPELSDVGHLREEILDSSLRLLRDLS